LMENLINDFQQACWLFLKAVVINHA
jgi:hypothetical protein